MRRLRFATLCVLTLIGCSSSNMLFSDAFTNLIQGSRFPVVPTSDSGFVMVMAMNDTRESIEFVVSAETEEIIATINGVGDLLAYNTRILEPQLVELLTDTDSPTLAAVFDNSPLTFPTAPPGALTFAEVQALVNELRLADENLVIGRETVRMIRVVRVGLGPNLDVPSGQDGGIIVRPAGSDPAVTAGSIFPSRLNNALSYVQGLDPADFGNGDLLIFLATNDTSSLGGVRVSAGVVQSQDGSFLRDTFEILRLEDGPINPPPP